MDIWCGVICDLYRVAQAPSNSDHFYSERSYEFNLCKWSWERCLGANSKEWEVSSRLFPKCPAKKCTLQHDGKLFSSHIQRSTHWPNHWPVVSTIHHNLSIISVFAETWRQISIRHEFREGWQLCRAPVGHCHWIARQIPNSSPYLERQSRVSQKLLAASQCPQIIPALVCPGPWSLLAHLGPEDAALESARPRQRPRPRGGAAGRSSPGGGVAGGKSRRWCGRRPRPRGGGVAQRWNRGNLFARHPSGQIELAKLLLPYCDGKIASLVVKPEVFGEPLSFIKAICERYWNGFLPNHSQRCLPNTQANVLGHSLMLEGMLHKKTRNIYPQAPNPSTSAVIKIPCSHARQVHPAGIDCLTM